MSRQLRITGQPGPDTFTVRVRPNASDFPPHFEMTMDRDELAMFVAEASGHLGWGFEVVEDEEP